MLDSSLRIPRSLLLSEVIDGEPRKRISLDELLKCVEEMDFVIDGELSDLIRSVVPEAAEAGEFSLDDAIKVSPLALDVHLPTILSCLLDLRSFPL